MSITTITRYPSTITIDGETAIGGATLGNLLIGVEDIDDGNSYTHKATLTLGSKTWESGYFSINTIEDIFNSFTFPLEWLEEIPNGTSRVGVLQVKTIKKVLLIPTTTVEINTKNVTFKVPSNIKPSINNLTIERIDGVVPSDWGVYVQNHSSCKLTATAEGSYGSTIKKYRFKLNGTVQSEQSNAKYTHLCTTSGSLKFAVIAIDSRGRESEPSEVSISVEPYEKPRINNVAFFRCNNEGKDDDEGNYVLAYVSYTMSSVNGKNTAVSNVSYAEANTENWTETTEIENNSPTVVFGELSAEKSYGIKFLVQDAIRDGMETSYIDVISTGFVTREYLAGGKGVALGKAAELEGYFDNDFKALLRQGFELPNTDWHQLTCNVSTAIGGATPEYQQLGHIVKIRGNVTGITARGKVIATLPEDARPSSSVTAIGTATGNCITFWSVGTNGNITLLFCLDVVTGAESYELNSYDFNINYLI